MHYENQKSHTATQPWEVRYCHPLKEKNGGPFVPLVTPLVANPATHGPEIRQGWTPGPTFPAEIVGYCGWVTGKDLWTPDVPPIPLGYQLPDNWNPGDDLPVTAHYARHDARYDDYKRKQENGWTHFHKFSIFHVVCSIDGEILAIIAKEGDLNGQAISTDPWIIDLVTGGFVFKKLAKAIGNRIITLATKAGRKALARATSSPANKKILWGTWNDYPKVTVNGEEYAKVGDRLYSRHAVERMQPSGLRSNRAAGQGDGSSDGGYPQMQQAGGPHPYAYGRGVPPYWVEEAIKVKGIPQANGNVAHRLGTLQVIVNDRGAVVTIETFSR